MQLAPQQYTKATSEYLENELPGGLMEIVEHNDAVRLQAPKSHLV
jgi:hypothetical protein